MDIGEPRHALEPGTPILGGGPDKDDAPLGPGPGDSLDEVEVHLLRGEVASEAGDGPGQCVQLGRRAVRVREVGEVGSVADEVRLGVPRQLALVEPGGRRKDDLRARGGLRVGHGGEAPPARVRADLLDVVVDDVVDR